MIQSGLIIFLICRFHQIGRSLRPKVSLQQFVTDLVDKLADWFEGYVKAMELNVWTSTTIQGVPVFDAATQLWTITLKRGQSERTLHPRHIILASGHSGEPNIPYFPGVESFKGDVHHSSQHPGGNVYAGKRAVVVGCCNSGHDIARGLYDHGAASVTMVQRSSTYVMSQPKGLSRIAGLYTEDGPSTEDADLFSCGIPFPVLKIIQQNAVYHLAKEDHEILNKLKAAGFKLDYEYDGSGMFIKYLLQGGGYYIDVGCSGLIGEGKIRIKQGHGIQEIVGDGIVFDDGSKLEADVIVLATGYQNMRETARKIFGDIVADRVTDVWGFNEKNEIATMWQSIPPVFVY
jgi:putative flavoprotein involved in K+ transport